MTDAPADIVLTREELYDRVWSTPMQKLASEFGLSDVGLAKVCKRHKIPRPSRGYQLKLTASAGGSGGCDMRNWLAKGPSGAIM